MTDTIKYRDMMMEMRTGKPFDIACCTYDAAKQTGGERIEYRQARKVDETQTAAKSRVNRLKNSKTATSADREILKNPNHRLNSTINIRTNAGTIRKVHARLIETFNGKTVIQ